ncbi:MAG: hypothetical protein HYY93_12135 [Planctomycetes bacterium]|nr:hypothetical protein [Planctomycetota bacterium]
MRLTALHVAVCALAALAPALTPEPTSPRSRPGPPFPGFPSSLKGRALVERPLTARERGVFADFPGRAGRFSDGEREVILRWVSERTRRLHPASECFAAIGYTIRPAPLRRDEQGWHWAALFGETQGPGLAWTIAERVPSPE